jgi:TolB protein
MTSVIREVRWRELLPGQTTQLVVHDVRTGDEEVLFETSELVLEAPNWHPSGNFISMNAGGQLYELDLRDATLHRIEVVGLADLNNDHLYSRDGSTVFLSSELTGHLFALPREGGVPARISNEHEAPFSHFLQGISADGGELSFVGASGFTDGGFASRLGTIPSTGGPETFHTEWTAPAVGFEYSPDGEWWYLNGELNARCLGDSQIYRMRPTGEDLRPLTHDDRVNWFPKMSPDGTRIVYLSYEKGALGHEANKRVELRMMTADGSGKRTIAEFIGGQGTLNVNSWAPTSDRFAYMRYPIAE